MSRKAKIIVISATEKEIYCHNKHNNVIYIVSGVGVINVSLAIYKVIRDYGEDIVRDGFFILVGIAGAVAKSLKIGEVVVVKSDFMGDLGAMRPEGFVAFDTTVYRSNYALDMNSILRIKSVAGVTVNTACSLNVERRGAMVESMEGAGFYAMAELMGLKTMQIRSVSNYIDTPREEWDVEGAIKNLGESIDKIVGFILSK